MNFLKTFHRGSCITNVKTHTKATAATKTTAATKATTTSTLELYFEELTIKYFIYD